MSELLAQSLSLPCGARLRNRLAKAAMTEGLADPAGIPTAELDRLYGLWSDGGAGLQPLPATVITSGRRSAMRVARHRKSSILIRKRRPR